MGISIKDNNNQTHDRQQQQLQLHFTTSIHIDESDGGGEGEEVIDCLCGKHYKVGSGSVFLENLTVHEVIGKIADINNSNICLICAAILTSILQDYWYLNNKKVTKERKGEQKT